MDRLGCAWLGRPSSIHVEEYDVELPLEVDDEYWEHPDPEKAFKQPPGKPSQMAYFVCQIRLGEMLVRSCRLLGFRLADNFLTGFHSPQHVWVE